MALVNRKQEWLRRIVNGSRESKPRVVHKIFSVILISAHFHPADKNGTKNFPLILSSGRVKHLPQNWLKIYRLIFCVFRAAAVFAAEDKNRTHNILPHFNSRKFSCCHQKGPKYYHNSFWGVLSADARKHFHRKARKYVALIKSTISASGIFSSEDKTATENFYANIAAGPDNCRKTVP